MKKLIAIMLVLALAACLFVACGDNGTEGDDTTTKKPDVTTLPDANTTGAPDVTTLPDGTTTGTPDVTTVPDVTTEAPIVTTQPEPEVTYPDIPSATDGIQDDVEVDIFD